MKRYIEDVNHKLKIHETLSTEFLEELLARLVIFQLLSCAFGLSAGVAISALLVGAAHLHNPNAAILSAVAIAIEAGLLLSGFYIATNLRWMSIGAHAGWDFTLGAILGAPVSGLPCHESWLITRFDATAPVWLTGGAFGRRRPFHRWCRAGRLRGHHNLRWAPREKEPRRTPTEIAIISYQAGAT